VTGPHSTFGDRDSRRVVRQWETKEEEREAEPEIRDALAGLTRDAG
jgi:hypothetical protein